jgi:hypothetical protein
MKFTQQLATAAAVFLTAVALSACGSGSGSSDQAYCDKVKTLGSIDTKLDNVDPTNLKASVALFDELAVSIKDIAGSSPEKIKGDWESMATIMSSMSSVMKPISEIDFADPSKITPEIVKDIEGMRPKMEALGSDIDAVGERIDVFTREKCGFAVGD